MQNKKITIGLIGFGYWGPILLRNFHNNENFEVLKVCDHNSEKLSNVVDISKNIKTCLDYKDILKDKEIDTVVIDTQARSHYSLIREALINNKNIFVEKPFTLSSKEALDIIKLNQKKKKIIMVDHSYLFTPQYRILKKLIKNKYLGNILHFHSTRADFGLFQKDTNILWHLLYHDAYILLDLFGKQKITNIKTSGFSHIVDKVADTAYTSFQYDSGFSAEVLVNMLFPVKERKIVITGTKRILYWDDTAADKLKIYNKSAVFDTKSKTFKYKLEKDFETVAVPKAEAIKTEVEYFSNCLKNKITPANDENSAYSVVKLIEKLESSVHKN